MKNSEQTQRLVRFDWAIKNLLRNHANYGVLEGFLSTLLQQDITIQSIEDSESTPESPKDRTTRVDVMVKNDKDEIFIIEVQNCYEYDYLLRMLFGASKTITNRVQKGDKYGESVPKLYHISIVYFELGVGGDYVYHGKTEFKGLHLKDILKLSEKQRTLLKRENVSDIFPEYYLIRANSFDDDVKDALDQWIYFLKNSAVRPDFNAKGLLLARDVWQYNLLTPEERNIYDRHLDDTRYETNIVEDARYAGKAEGLAEGKAEEKLANARGMKSEGIPLATIARITGLPLDQLERL